MNAARIARPSAPARVFRIIALGVAVIASTRSAAAQTNPFTPYLTHQAPKIVEDLGSEVQGNISIHRVVFYSRTVPTPAGPVDSKVYAFIARPSAPGRYPGILLLHGGGGSAQEGLALHWAQLGYVVVAPDLPGIANPAKIPRTSGAFKQAEYGKNHFRLSPDATASDIFDGALAGLQALYLLRAQPDVDTTNIGVTGVSWGGYSTITIAGLAGDDVKAAFALYGSGHYDLGTTYAAGLAKETPAEQAAWSGSLDAKNFAPHITAQFFEASATDDVFFWMPAVAATYDDIHAPKGIVFSPNTSHWMTIPGGGEKAPGPLHDNAWMDEQPIFFDYLLKGQGQPFPSLRDVSAGPGDGKTRHVRFIVRGAVGDATAHVYYTAPGLPWPKRVWTEVPATLAGDRYEAEIPVDTDWFASVSDSRPVTVSSPMQFTPEDQPKP
jgi:dienelactone hydrolase